MGLVLATAPKGTSSGQKFPLVSVVSGPPVAVQSQSLAVRMNGEIYNTAINSYPETAARLLTRATLPAQQKLSLLHKRMWT